MFILTSSEDVGELWVSYHLYVIFMGSWAEMGLLCSVALLREVFWGREGSPMTTNVSEEVGSESI